MGSSQYDNKHPLDLLVICYAYGILYRGLVVTEFSLVFLVLYSDSIGFVGIE